METRQIKLMEFVKIAHIEQKRKYTGEPYFNHIFHVGTEAQKNQIQFGFEIGICHDLFEDTQFNEELLRHFLWAVDYSIWEIDAIIAGINHLTDEFTSDKYPELNRKARKQKECERLYLIPEEIQTIKYIDLIHNTESICEHDPGFARTYLKEKWQILKGMDKGNPELFLQARNLLVINLNKLGDEGDVEW